MIANQMIESDFSYQHHMEKPGLNPRIRSIVLDIRARHGALRILGIGRGAQPLCHHLRHAGYTVVFMESGESSESQNLSGITQIDGYSTSFIDPSPIREAPFDMAVSVESDRPSSKPSALIKVAAAKLEQGGIFILSMPYGGCLSSLVLNLLYKWWKHPHFRASGSDHIQCWCKKCLTATLKSYGFAIVEFIGVRGPSLQWETLILVARKTG